MLSRRRPDGRRRATERIGLDHLPYASAFVADRVADTFAALKRS